MKERVTAIFDVGKTNKKFFLFDQQHQVLHEAYTQLTETVDEDGHPTEDLAALTAWVRDTFAQFAQHPKYDIDRLNFSGYGASLVHLDGAGLPVAKLQAWAGPWRAKKVASRSVG
jgi:L-fuculokinase